MGHPGVVPTAWALLRLAAVGVVSPLLGPLITSAAARNTRVAHALIERYPALIAEVAAGRPPNYVANRVGEVSAGERWFVSSDLHRCVPGTVDWPAQQRTNTLYEAALRHYADEGWGLIENGDVEDFWLVGGSTYGVVYDLARLAGHAVRGATGRQIRIEIAIDHLHRIVAHNRRVYDLIDQRFHRHGRYRRVVGNHDDVYLEDVLVAALGEVHADIAVHDFITLIGEIGETGGTSETGETGGTGVAVGVITHGHHTDGWNAPHRSGLGKLGTWAGSAVLDTPRVSNPGVPDKAGTARLLAGRAPNALTRVGRRFGVNRELYSLDEVRLHEAWRRHFPRDAEDGDQEPWLLLGHTHVPLSEPRDPATNEIWSRYANSGAGIFYECITGIEWDGTSDPRHPEVRVVVWRYADPDPASAGEPIAPPGDRAIVRQVLRRDGDDDHLVIVAPDSESSTAP